MLKARCVSIRRYSSSNVIESWERDHIDTIVLLHLQDQQQFRRDRDVPGIGDSIGANGAKPVRLIFDGNKKLPGALRGGVSTRDTARANLLHRSQIGGISAVVRTRIEGVDVI